MLVLRAACSLAAVASMTRVYVPPERAVDGRVRVSFRDVLPAARVQTARVLPRCSRVSFTLLGRLVLADTVSVPAAPSVAFAGTEACSVSAGVTLLPRLRSAK